MTTDTRRTSVLRGALSWSIVPVLGSSVVAFLMEDSAGLIGALIGAIATVVILGGGTWAVIKVSTISPVASLMAALCAFTAQGLLLVGILGIVSVVADRPTVVWAAISIIAVTVVWTSSFGYFVRKERIPLFDLSGSGESR